MILPAPGLAQAAKSNRQAFQRKGPAAIALLAVAALGIGGTLWYRGRPPDPPAPAWTGIDPAIVAAVERARAAVLRSPRSGSAWGRLGMVLAAHDFSRDANFCFAQAERFDPWQPRWPYYQAVALAQGDPEAAIPKLERAVGLMRFCHRHAAPPLGGAAPDSGPLR